LHAKHIVLLDRLSGRLRAPKALVTLSDAAAMVKLVAYLHIARSPVRGA
jgi:hypothetical protein